MTKLLVFPQPIQAAGAGLARAEIRRLKPAPL